MKSLFGGSRFLTYEELRKELNGKSPKIRKPRREDNREKVSKLGDQATSSKSVVQKKNSENTDMRKRLFEGEILDMIRTPEINLLHYKGFPRNCRILCLLLKICKSWI